MTLGDVLFDTGKATLKPGAYATIDRLATVLKEDPARKVLIEGHTDSVGSDEYNQSLSERRAASVQAALFERGVEASQISTVGKGETHAGREQRRRCRPPAEPARGTRVPGRSFTGSVRYRLRFESR